MTLPMPLWDGTQDGLQYILDLLAQSVIDTGGRSVKLRWGQASVAFSGGTEATQTVNHGLGTVPIAAFATPLVNTTEYLDVGVREGADATSMTIQFTAGTGIFTTFTFYWLALG